MAAWGYPIMADVVKVRINSSVMEDGKWPYVIDARCSHGGTTYNFTSNVIWFDPTPYLKNKIQVFVDQRNYKKYYVDIDFLNDKGST